MKLAELIICIAIYLLIFTTVLSTYGVLLRNVGKLTDETRGIAIVIETDMQFREKIKGIDIKYWKNSEQQVIAFCNALIDMNGKCKVTRADVIRDTNGQARGIKIRWIYNGREHETEELFSGRTPFVEKK